MSVRIELRVINKGRTQMSATIQADDYDAAMMDLMEAESILGEGEWLERRIMPGSGQIPDKYRGKI